MAQITLGMKNKNPLNVKQGATAWKGSTGKDKAGHVIFQEERYGVRAAVRTLQQKFLNGKRTIKSIIAAWAPSSDTIGSIAGAPKNQPSLYAQFVARRVGVSDNTPLRLFKESGAIDDRETLMHIVRAMAEYENFVDFKISPLELNQGIELFQRDFY